MIQTEFYVFVFIDEDGVLRFEFDEDEDPKPYGDYVDFSTASMYYTWYIEDYFDTSILNQELADIYFLGILSPEFEIQRSLDLGAYDSVVIEYIIDPLGEDGFEFLEASLILQTGTITEYRIDMFRFLYFEDDTIMIEFEYIFVPNVLELVELTEIMNGYFTDFNDVSITSEDFCVFYHENEDILSKCIYFREEMLNNELSLVLTSIDPIDFSFYELHLEVYFQGGYSHDMFLELYTFYDADDLYFDILYYIDSYDPLFENLQTAFEDFAYGFSIESYDSLEYCQEYSFNPSSCVILRDELLDRGLINVHVNELYFLDTPEFGIEYFVVFEYEFDDLSFEIHTYLVDAYYDESNGLVYFDLSPADGLLPPPVLGEVVDSVLTEATMISFYSDFANSFLTNDDICDLYFDSVFNDMNCGEERTNMLNDNLVTTVISFMPYIDMFGEAAYIMEIDFTTDSGSFILTEIMRVYILDNDNLYIEFVFEEPIDTFMGTLVPLSETEDIYQSFVDDWNNIFLDNDDICEIYYFLPDPNLTCELDRTQLQIDGFYFSLVGVELLNDPLYGDYHSIELALSNGDTTHYFNYSQYVFYDLEDVLVIADVWETFK